MPDFIPYNTARRFGGVPPGYLEEENELLPLDEAEIPLGGRPAPPQVPAELRRILGGAARPSGDPYEVAEASRKGDAYVEAVKGKPERPQAKWWQKLAAAGLGAAAGYSNASERGRPIDVSGATEEILAPGYGRKLEDWKGKVQAAGVERDTANANRDAWWKNRKNEADISQSEAQAEQARQHGAYWANKADDERNQWKVDSKGNMYNTVTGERKNLPPTMAEKQAELQNMKDADGNPLFSTEDVKVLLSGGKLGEPKPEKPRNLVNVAPGHTVYDPETGKPVFSAPDRPDKDGRPMTRGQSAMIERRKNDLLMKAEAKARQRVKGDPVKGIEPEPSDAVYAELEEEKQRIQNAYEGEIAAATGGDPGHFEYPEPAAPKPAQPSTGGRGPKPPATAQSKPPQDVLDRLEPGEHTFRNGQTIRKHPDGRIEFVTK
jgi:hypothetical protein